jgi:hypothetical protein
MEMNAKLILLGGIAWYATAWVVSMATASFIHEGVLADDYLATAAFWRPELMQDPPDMAALMPRWLATGLMSAFLTALVYGWLRPAFTGPGWLKGIKFGLVALILHGCFMMGWSGVFGLPDHIWVWWWVESALYFVAAGAVLGWVADRFAPLRHGY